MSSDAKKSEPPPSNADHQASYPRASASIKRHRHRHFFFVFVFVFEGGKEEPRSIQAPNRPRRSATADNALAVLRTEPAPG